MDNKLDNYYEHVQEKGHLLTEKLARRWSDGVLKTLGVNLDRGTKKALAKQLPEELADSLQGVFWLLHFRDTELSSYEFQNQVARRCGNSDPEFARYPTVAVFSGIQSFIDNDVRRRVAESLSPEVSQLWEQAQAKQVQAQ